MSPDFRHIYIHIPFCDVICHYCDFYTARTKDAHFDHFFEALIKETRDILDGLSPQLSAIYFGGGTPSTADPERIRELLDLMRSRIGDETEITLEANPRDISRERVSAWKHAGINRLSLGIQSLQDGTLRRLGRAHSAENAREALRICLAEIENVTGDLIYGVPGQMLEEPAYNAREMAELGVKHFSAYNLTLSKQHFLHASLPDDAFAFDQIQMVANELSLLGFQHYEISNFGKTGFESKNNLNYWRGGPYQALGPSAHGFDGQAFRWQNVADWKQYVSRLMQGDSPIEFRETLGPEQRKIEAIFTGLRLEGLDIGRIEETYHCDILRKNAALFGAWEKEGLGKLDGRIFIPSFRGRMLADEIARKLL